MELKLIIFILRGIAWLLFGIFLLFLALLALSISPKLSGIIAVGGIAVGVIGFLMVMPERQNQSEGE
jgi:hypothetical protein